jgi:hypothetical protein
MCVLRKMMRAKKSIILYLLKECIYMIIYMIIFIVDNNELFLREGMP